MGGKLAEVWAWVGELEALHERSVHRFSRSEPRESALAYMQGLIAPLERKNGWRWRRRRVTQALTGSTGC